MATDEILTSVDPASGEVVGQYPVMDATALETLLGAVARAQAGWQQGSPEDRTAPIRALGGLLRRDRETHAQLITREMGKPITQARGEVDKCAWACDYYAEVGPGFLAPEGVATDCRVSRVVYRPLGVVLAIMPWNFPLWQVVRCAVPALLAGNGVVLKHAPAVSGCALAVEATVREAGFPEHLLRAALVKDEQAEAVVDDPRIAAVSLTGSTRAGRAVARRAGAGLKKVVLELGGSDPYVVLEDADIPSAARSCAAARLVNSGQSCVAAKRFIVVDAVHDAFEAAFTEALRSAVAGNPMDEATEVGPLARPDLRHTLHRQLTASVEQGARCVLGGHIPERDGYYYPPSLLTGVSPGMPAFDDELFGPVAALVPVPDEAAAIRAANAGAYGLGAAVFTVDEARGQRIAADELQAGLCFVNAAVRSDPRLPFGGVKASGFGRELSRFGVREFVNVKTVAVP